MRRISSPTLTSAVVAVVVVSASAVGAGIGNAQAEGKVQAEDCLAAPNAASPPGQHWYYRIDRATRRHCWYLHAPLSIAHQTHRKSVLVDAKIDGPVAAAPAPVPAAAAPIPFAAVPMPAASMPAAVAPMPAADAPPAASGPAADNTQNLPHVAVVSVKTIAVRPSGAEAATQSRHGVGGPSIQDASVRAYGAIAEKKSEPTTFFALVFGLGAAAFLMAIVVKSAMSQANWPWRRIRLAADVDWKEEPRDESSPGPMRLTGRTWSAR